MLATFPKFTVYPNAIQLPLPPRLAKPALPPRPIASTVSSSRSVVSPLAQASRLSGLFSFGSRSSTPSQQAPTALTAHSSSAPDHERDSIASSTTERTIPISSVVIDKRIVLAEISRTVHKATQRHIHTKLKEETNVPTWLLDRVDTFLSTLLPFVKLPANARRLQNPANGESKYGLQTNPLLWSKPPREVSSIFQSFYREVEDELERRSETERHGNLLTKPPPSTPPSPLPPTARSQEQREQILSALEQTLTTVLYPKLFTPDESDDSQHDDALSSRIAALNLLDLGLIHLGVDIDFNWGLKNEEAGEDEKSIAVKRMIKECGNGKWAWSS